MSHHGARASVGHRRTAQVAAGHNTQSCTPRPKPSSPPAAGVRRPTFLFVCNGKLWEVQTEAWVPAGYGRDFSHVWSPRKIQTGHAKEGLSLKGKTVSPDPKSRQMASSPVSWALLSLHKARVTEEDKESDQRQEWPLSGPGEKKSKAYSRERTWGVNDVLREVQKDSPLHPTPSHSGITSSGKRKGLRFD